MHILSPFPAFKCCSNGKVRKSPMRHSMCDVQYLVNMGSHVACISTTSHMRTTDCSIAKLHN